MTQQTGKNLLTAIKKFVLTSEIVLWYCYDTASTRTTSLAGTKSTFSKFCIASNSNRTYLFGKYQGFQELASDYTFDTSTVSNKIFLTEEREGKHRVLQLHLQNKTFAKQ